MRPARALEAAADPTSAPQTQPSGRELLGDVMARWARLIEPPAGEAPRTFTARLKLTRAEGLPTQAAGATGEIAFQAPSHLRASAQVDGKPLAVGRDGNELWFDEPAKHFAMIGRSGLPLFRSTPSELDDTHLPPFKLPLPRVELAAIPLLVTAELLPPRSLDGRACDVLRLTPLPRAAALLHLAGGTIELAVHHDDLMPARIGFSDGRRLNVQLDFEGARLEAPWTAERWKLTPSADEKVQTVPLAHLARFLEVAPSVFADSVPTLGPSTGERKLIATEGEGRLELVDGTRVLFLKGSPAEMGHQHGTLLKREINQVMDRILYGVGVASSFERGSWFFGDIEGAVDRMQPFIDPRYTEEMDSIAVACGRRPAEARLANFFPELFHCSGFSLFGKATRDGHMYHGRVLDYLRGVGLEKSAVVIVHRPNHGHAWINLSYAGFVGTVTAMNERGISIGEMGGGGWGNWDGKPMAELLREVMEKASTLDEAVAILRAGPRTCQYYYVVSDGLSKKAVGIAATPSEFVTVQPGEYHPLLPRPMEDAVLLSAGQRYQTLADRVKSGYGTFDADSARELMAPPVCMKSNIQSVLFSPDTLDVWVANADSANVASSTRYTHYNLHELLTESPPSAPVSPTPSATGNPHASP